MFERSSRDDAFDALAPATAPTLPQTRTKAATARARDKPARGMYRGTRRTATAASRMSTRRTFASVGVRPTDVRLSHSISAAPGAWEKKCDPTRSPYGVFKTT